MFLIYKYEVVYNVIIKKSIKNYFIKNKEIMCTFNFQTSLRLDQLSFNNDML